MERVVKQGVFSYCLVILMVFSCWVLAPDSAMAAPPKFGGTLIVGIPVDPFSFNPLLTTSLQTAYVTGQIYNRLINADWKGDLTPSLAQKWEVSSDGLKYTFHLAQNVLWNDSKPFTSADVKFSFEALAKYHPAGAASFGAIDRVETPSPHTVVVYMKNPFPSFLMGLYQTRMACIIPRHIYEGTDIQTNPHNVRNPVGTGPFMVKEWVKGNNVTLVRNPNYFLKDQPYLDRLIFRVFADPSTQLAAFEAGEVDYLPWNLPPHEAKRLEKNPKFVVKTFSTGMKISHVLGFNIRKPYLKDVRVRQAIAHAIDKAHLLKTVDFDYGKVMDSIVPNEPGSAWYHNPDVKRYPFDLKKAEQLLDEAGFPRKSGGMRFQISVVNTFADPSVIKNTEIIRDWLKKIGIDLQIETRDTATGFERVFKRWDFDVWYYMVGLGPDPQVAIRRFYHTENIRNHAGVVNACGFSNPRVDRLFEMAAKEMDQKKQAEYYREFQKIAMEDLTYLPIYNAYAIQAVNKDFEGIPVGFDSPMEAMDTPWWTKGSDKR